ncbi:MAG: TetR/AcrR family transcriptional regulator, partial [Desulfomonilaceae bacterium]
MVSPLEKARKDPDSMKGRILSKARRIFGEYGFHGATTRMIAEEVGIDISTLYYHWGEKGDLYEAVILDMNEDLRQKLLEVENLIHGLPLAERLAISLDLMTDYLFEHPEISNLILFRYFGKTRDESILDFHVPEVVSGIARSMGLCKDKRNVPDRVRMQVHALMNSIHNFVSGE